MLDGPYGVSVLEPFVQIEIQREVMTQVRDIGDAWDRPEVPEQARQQAKAQIPLAQRQLAELDERTVALLGGARTIDVTPQPGLYFRGMELRAIHLSRLRFVRACRARVVWRGGGPS